MDSPDDQGITRFETLAVHEGRQVDPVSGAVTPAIQPSTTFERDADGGYSRGHVYSRQSNPNRQQLETCLAALEGGQSALAFASGSAATMSILQLLRPGDHVLITDDAYHGSRHLLDTLFRQWGLQHDRVDTTDTEAVAAAIRPDTRLLWIESPSNPLQGLSDLEALGALASEHEIITVCDNTLASPVGQNPLRHGMDLVLHSSTKYLGGHSDLLGGAVIHRDNFAQAQALRDIQSAGGAVPSAFDCWLLLRSLSTLSVRVRAQADSARTLMERLDEHPAVETVFHAMHPNHPHRARAKQYLRGGGALFAFTVRGKADDAMRLVAATRLFTRATSLGGVESLIEHRASIEGPGTRTPDTLVRLSIGLEHVEDLWADLQQALEHIRKD
ncbi:trans-sulfuration enzyme family protein [Natronospira bacteriovora]|uniref:Aminotransferase class I/II-fold pyridoxal phosphate-dependent enzyme n=1 Tax=Natronospira bacteriovora TaxID=3069753 RepID=A0ABU0WA06_9GAMM|nr:aminotransferase class I/II-fold pyridoxal phosphate-dependent enzyme [Natronospira sp. AB-CW4]MDQ2070863.1 aminotransferase class I/II-fold pyridoxal phosphate-dependent enzyme [Natronospira sp. AB-CW4]